ncbi:GSTM3 [Branchiostoma lanceolatum]|uniref:glutathione transferase n=1 Tax=Branchiostoma lanceolatum TaxID=7740 RepID=A0A8J9ZCI2_BRALA|nr:GSTM3 [Branchiostoma lanceolatum]
MPVVLGYWRQRAYGQSIRLMLEYTETDYKEEVYVCAGPPDFSKDCWRSIKDNFGLAFPNLPYYIDGDLKLTHSMAIMRHLGRKNNLYGVSEEEQIRQDMLEQQVCDFRDAYYGLTYNAKDFEKEKVDYLKELPKELRRFSSFLGEKSWFVSEKMTYCDFLVYEHLDQHRVLEPTCLNGFKNLEDFMDRFEALPKIAAYLKSDRFYVHPICNRRAKFSNEPNYNVSDNNQK